MPIESLEQNQKETDPFTRPNQLELLERGEVEYASALEGWAPIKVVKIKDDGKALFKPEYKLSDSEYLAEKKGLRRATLELLAFRIDQALGFNLVPETSIREIQETTGAMQRFVADSTVAFRVSEWQNFISRGELIKAATFD